MRRELVVIFSIIIAICLNGQVDAKRKTKKGKFYSTQLSHFLLERREQDDTKMCFIYVRKGHVHHQGIDKMAGDFSSVLATGGTHIDLVGADDES